MKPGEKFNRLTVVKFSHVGKHSRSYFHFRCDCGNEKVILGAVVKSGTTKSCGCLGSEIRKSRRVSSNHSEVTAIILGYKRHAQDRGLSWKLSRKGVLDIIFRDCAYCGSPPSNRKKTKNSLSNGLMYSGIDRLDSTKGYLKNNTVPCCRSCNYAKSDLTVDEFRRWAIRLGEKAMADQWQ